MAIEVFRATAAEAFRKEWAMRDQVRRAALSVPSNIAEGSARGVGREAARFYLFARGSLAELATQIDIAGELGMLEPDLARAWQAECQQLGAMLTKLIHRQALQLPPNA